MENIVISNNIDNSFEFDATAQGLDIKSGKLLLHVAVSDQLSYTIKCTHIAGVKWAINIPKNTFENGTFDYTLSVIVDNFYFEPMVGKLEVVHDDSITVVASEQANDTTAKPKVEKPKAEKTKAEKTKVKLKEVKDTVEKIGKNGYQFFKTDHPYEKLSDHGEKDRKVKLLLKELEQT